MHVRCQRCHAAFWFRGGTEPDVCECGQVYRFAKAFSSARLKRLKDRARQLATEHDVDLPSGYSIAMGLLTVDQVRDAQRPAAQRAEAPRPREGSISAEDKTPLAYDRKFQPAIDGGCLTPEQAFERGSREAFALRVAKRHGLSESLAYAVADNRMSVLAALRRRDDRPQAPAIVADTAKRRGRSTWAGPVLAVACVGIVALALWAWQATRTSGELPSPALLPVARATASPSVSAAPGSRVQRLRSATNVERNGNGLVLRIEGPDPRSVALAFVEATGPERQIELLDLSPSTPPDPRRRMAVLRELESKTFRALPIHQDPQTRRWVAGDGLTPLKPDPASESVLRTAIRR
jgi:hypothetical protein